MEWNDAVQLFIANEHKFRISVDLLFYYKYTELYDIDSVLHMVSLSAAFFFILFGAYNYYYIWLWNLKKSRYETRLCLVMSG